jgi:hypothetical protein
MSFCEHCAGQRFDRAQVLHTLRDARRQIRNTETLSSADEVLKLAIQAIRSLDIPHLELLEEMGDDSVIH